MRRITDMLTPGSNKLTAEQMARRLPEGVRDGLAEWSFDAFAMNPTEGRSRQASDRLRQTAKGLVRVAGIVRYAPAEDGDSILLATGKEYPDVTTLHVRAPSANRYRSLSCLAVDMSIVLDPEAAISQRKDRSGTLQFVYGIQAPLKPGESSGVAHGVVTGVAGEDVPIGMQLETAGGPIDIRWDEWASRQLLQARIPVVDSVVAISLTQDALGGPGDYYSNGNPGGFRVMEQPLTPTV